MTRVRPGEHSAVRATKVLQAQTIVVENRAAAVVAPVPSVNGVDLPQSDSWTTAPEVSPDRHAADEELVVRGGTHAAFLGSMTAFGLFHPTRFGKFGGRLRPLFTAYSFGVLVLLSVNAARMSATFFLPLDGNSDSSAVTASMPVFLLKATTYSWQLQTTVVAAIFFFKCWSKGSGGLANYYAKLNAISDELALVGMRPKASAERRFEAVCLVSAWIVAAANGAYAVRFVVLTLSDADKSLLRWSIDDTAPSTVNSTAAAAAGNASATADDRHNYVAAAVVSVLVSLYGAGGTGFGVIYVLLICRQLCALLSCFNRELDRLTATAPQDFLRRVGDYRQMHGSLCDLVASANSGIAHLIGVHICYYFGSSMVQAYLIATQGTNGYWPVMRVGIGIWMATAIVIVGVEFAACCIVIDKVQESEEYLERIPYSRSAGTDCDQIVQLQLFLNQIKRDRGFSIFGIYPISMDSLLPMIGTWITYFLLIVQFSTAPSSTSNTDAASNENNVA